MKCMHEISIASFEKSPKALYDLFVNTLIKIFLISKCLGALSVFINFGIALVALAKTLCFLPKPPFNKSSVNSDNFLNNPSTSIKSLIGINLSLPDPSVFSLNT